MATSADAPDVSACAGEAARQRGMTAGINIRPAPCAFAIRNDHMNKPPRPTCMAVSDQDSRGVPMPRAVLLGGLDEALDLAVGEIFTAALANCYIYCGWSRFAKPQVFHGNSPPARSYCYRFKWTCNRSGWMFKPSAADSGSRAADQVRSCHQSHDREGAWL